MKGRMKPRSGSTPPIHARDGKTWLLHTRIANPSHAAGARMLKAPCGHDRTIIRLSSLRLNKLQSHVMHKVGGQERVRLALHSHNRISHAAQA